MTEATKATQLTSSPNSTESVAQANLIQSKAEKNNTKLNDTQVAQVIDEVSTEQENAQLSVTTDKPEENEEQFRGFIGKFTSKFKDLKKEDDDH